MSMTQNLITPRLAASWIPDFDDIVGNHRILDHLGKCLRYTAPQDDANVLLEGPPGTGKTNTLLSFLQRRLGDPTLCEDDDADVVTVLRGRQIGFMRIDGGTSSEARLRDQLKFAQHNATSHTLVLLDELGELYHRRYDEMLRPILDSRRVTLFATAQNFHSGKRRSDTVKEDNFRRHALLRRFPIKETTSPPGPDELETYILKLSKQWSFNIGDDHCIKTLIQKATLPDGINVGEAMSILARCLADPARTLTTDLVMRI